jgi:uncharacterized protein
MALGTQREMPRNRGDGGGIAVRPKREADMARSQDGNIAGAGRAPDTGAGQELFELGLICATKNGAADLISAHKWFNLAALYGNKHAGVLRLEVAGEMSDSEIAVKAASVPDSVRPSKNGINSAEAGEFERSAHRVL